MSWARTAIRGSPAPPSPPWRPKPRPPLGVQVSLYRLVMANIYLNENNIDDLARMLTSLVSEVWIMRDRMAVMEKMLGEKVGVTSKEIDDFIPTPDFSAELEVLRDRLVTNVIG